RHTSGGVLGCQRDGLRDAVRAAFAAWPAAPGSELARLPRYAAPRRLHRRVGERRSAAAVAHQRGPGGARQSRPGRNRDRRGRRRPGGDAGRPGHRSGAGARAAPIPVGDGIVVATTADTLYLLERASGQVRTRLHTPGTMIAAPALDGARLYAATTAGRMLAIDFPALTVAWDLPAGDAVLG